MSSSGAAGEPGGAVVGPVLEAGPTAWAVIAVMRRLHPDLSLLDRGAYLRVSVPGRCVLDLAELERRHPPIKRAAVVEAQASRSLTMAESGIVAWSDGYLLAFPDARSNGQRFIGQKVRAKVVASHRSLAVASLLGGPGGGRHRTGGRGDGGADPSARGPRGLDVGARR